MRNKAIALALMLACGAAAAGPDDDVPTVQVEGLKNPATRSYRAFVAGLDAFEAHRALAPAVKEPRFVALQRYKQDPGTPPLALRIAGDEVSIPVALAEDGSFVLPRNEAAYDKKAELTFNRNRQHIPVVIPDLRTPGLPGNVRRMGDLRLECQVQVAIMKEELPLWVALAGNVVLRTTDWCGKQVADKYGGYTQPSAHKLAAVTISEGGRTLELRHRTWSYTTPTADASWSDEALVELRYADD